MSSSGSLFTNKEHKKEDEEEEKRYAWGVVFTSAVRAGLVHDVTLEFELIWVNHAGSLFTNEKKKLVCGVMFTSAMEWFQKTC